MTAAFDRGGEEEVRNEVVSQLHFWQQYFLDNSPNQEWLLERVMQMLTRLLPIEAVSIILAKTDEGVVTPPVTVGVANNYRDIRPLEAKADDQVVRKLLVETTRFQQQLVVMLEHSLKDRGERLSVYDALERDIKVLERRLNQLKRQEEQTNVGSSKSEGHQNST